MAAPEPELEPVSDLKTIQRYLRYGVEFHELVACRSEGAEEFRFEADFRAVDERTLTLELDVTQTDFALLNGRQLATLDEGEARLRLSYSVNEATFFVRARVLGRASRRLTVKASPPMHKLQRRESLRIKVIDSHKASVRLGPESFPLYDLSAGGLSFVVGLAQEKQYPPGTTFSGAELSFLGQVYKVNLEVKNVLAHGRDGGKVKIGFSFNGLPAAIEQAIAREAYLHTHKIWSRWI